MYVIVPTCIIIYSLFNYFKNFIPVSSDTCLQLELQVSLVCHYTLRVKMAERPQYSSCLSASCYTEKQTPIKCQFDSCQCLLVPVATFAQLSALIYQYLPFLTCNYSILNSMISLEMYTSKTRHLSVHINN